MSIVSKHATLPDTAATVTHLRDMQIGDTGYTVPWAMSVDRDRKCWLRASYTIDTQPGGTVQMRVTRREDGYHVWLVDGHAYDPVELPAFEFLPVVELHDEGMP